MKVLLRKNISKLGKIGDLVEVKSGYARNYLLPQGLAAAPTKANLKAVEIEKQRYLEDLASRKDEFEARAAACQGKEVTIQARANEEGHLYGSIGPAQIAAALAEQGVFVEADNVVLDTPLRKLDKYDVTVSFTDEINATVAVWVVALQDEDTPLEAPPDEPADQATEDEAPAEKTPKE